MLPEINWETFCPCFRLIRWTYPWGMLMAIALRLPFTQGTRRSRETLRLWVTLFQVNWAETMLLVRELLIPETWV